MNRKGLAALTCTIVGAVAHTAAEPKTAATAEVLLTAWRSIHRAHVALGLPQRSLPRGAVHLQQRCVDSNSPSSENAVGVVCDAGAYNEEPRLLPKMSVIADANEYSSSDIRERSTLSVAKMVLSEAQPRSRGAPCWSGCGA